MRQTSKLGMIGTFPYRRFETLHLLCYAFLVMAVTFLISFHFYTGYFDIIYMPFSYLGDSITVKEGNPNTISLVLFSIGCCLSGILMFIFANRIGNEPGLKYSYYLKFLGFISGMGFILMIIPDNIGFFIHDLGAILSLGGIWVITSVLMLEVRHRTSTLLMIIMNLILHSTMTTYAILATIDVPIKNLFQKFGLVGLFIVTAWVIRVVSLRSSRDVRDPYAFPESNSLNSSYQIDDDPI